MGAPEERVAALLDKVARALDPVVEGLGKVSLDETAPAAEPAAAVTPESLLPQIRQLMQLLAESDTEAVDLWEARQGAFKAAFPEHWQPIAAALGKFDFEAALAALRQAADAARLEA